MTYIITDLSTNKTYDAADRFGLEDALNTIFDRDERAGDLTIGEVIDALVAKVAAGEYSGYTAWEFTFDSSWRDIKCVSVSIMFGST